MAARKSSGTNADTTLHHLWLAAVGALSIARREAKIAAEIALDETAVARQRVMQVAGDTRDIARGILLTVQEQVEPRLGPLAADIEMRLSPLLEELGLRRPTPPPVRKARKPSVKKASGRSASARKHADVRIARKGR